MLADDMLADDPVGASPLYILHCSASRVYSVKTTLFLTALVPHCAPSQSGAAAADCIRVEIVDEARLHNLGI